MSAENLGLGDLLDPELLPGRDAVHIAVMPVMADTMLRPGQRVAISHFFNGTPVVSAKFNKTIGIVDPFLRVPVMRGQCCWLWLDPGSITSLRHEWTHPGVDVGVEA